jgi:HlyD family secretion protein
MKCLPTLFISTISLLLAACGSGSDGRMVGELAWDRVELANEAAEPIRHILVQEGQQVAANTLLVQLDTRRVQAALDGIMARVTETKLELDRQQKLVKQRLASPEQVDRAESAWKQAKANEQEARLALERLSIRAPRAGRVDALPFEVGERPPVSSVLAVLLVGDAPYARLYVPEPLRNQVAVGTKLRVWVDGHEGEFTGQVRRISSDPVFTPFYALSEHDRSQLAYLAEVTLHDAADLPAGLPAEAEIVEEEPEG